MNAKNFLGAGLAGAVTNFLLGWLFYGILLGDMFPQPEENSTTMIMIFLGCLALGLFMAYIFINWAQVATAGAGAKAGAIISLFIALYFDFFQLAMNPDATYTMVGIDIIVMIIMGAITGAVVGLVVGKTS